MLAVPAYYDPKNPQSYLQKLICWGWVVDLIDKKWTAVEDNGARGRPPNIKKGDKCCKYRATLLDTGEKIDIMMEYNLTNAQLKRRFDGQLRNKIETMKRRKEKVRTRGYRTARAFRSPLM